MSPELGGKRLQLLKEIVPGLSRVAILWNGTNPFSSRVVREIEAAAPTLDVQLQSLVVRGLDDFDAALTAATGGRANALLVVEDPFVVARRPQIVEFAARIRLPAMYGLKEVCGRGGSHVLRSALCRLVPAGGDLCGPDPERLETS